MTDTTHPAPGIHGDEPALDLPDADRTYELDRQHVFYPWSAQASLAPMVVTGSEGSYVWDGHGNRLLDFTSQLVYTNLGHQHPRVVEAIQRQAATLCTAAPSYATAPRSEAARLIASHTPGDLDRIFFTAAGADANEHAIRMARLHTGRHKVLSRYRSYHGGTQLAVNVTGEPRRWPNDTGSQGTVHFFGPFLYRSRFHARDEREECERALAHLSEVIDMEGPSTIAAIMLEPVPGTSGIMVPPEGYLRGVRELCDRHGILLIADEVMAGFGRTGHWFAIEHAAGVVPDLLTFAKGVTSGYVPLGGVAISDAVSATFAERPYPGGLTYSGHTLACAAAVATIRTMEDEDVVGQAARLGDEVLGPGLAELATRHAWVGEVRGAGAFWALELVRDRETREPLAPYGGSSPEMAALAQGCISRGLLPFVNFNRLHVVPPLTISAQEAREGLSILDEALSEARGRAT